MITAACILIAALFMLFSSSGETVCVSVDGVTVERIDLSHEGEYTVKGHDSIRFGISGGGVEMISSDCPDKICVKTGKITDNVHSIVCMPNKVVIWIE